MPPYFPLRCESTGDQWWYASPIDLAAANGQYDLVRELLRIDNNHLITLTSLRRIHRLEAVWDTEAQRSEVAKNRCFVAQSLLLEFDTQRGKSSLIHAGYGGWLLYIALAAGDMDFVRDLLERNPLLVFGEGEYGITDMLYASCTSKDCDLFRFLYGFVISQRFLPCPGRGDGAVFEREMMNRAVHAASRSGNLVILKELLAGCTDLLVYRDKYGSTALHTAAANGQIEVVEFLLCSSDIATSTDSHGNTASHIAAFYGHSNVLELLISGASGSSIFSTNHKGDTVLHMAVTGCLSPSFGRLDHRIQVLKKLTSGELFSAADIINRKNNEGRTALHVAIHRNAPAEVINILMSVRSVFLNVRDSGGMTPLDLLRKQPGSASSGDVMRRLISAGGVSGYDDNSEKPLTVSRVKMGTAQPDPGTIFAVPDSEIIFLTSLGTNQESAGRYHTPIALSKCGQDPEQGSNRTSGSRTSSRPVSQLKSIFESSTSEEERGKTASTAFSDGPSKKTPTPLRERYAVASSMPHCKRICSSRNYFSGYSSGKTKHSPHEDPCLSPRFGGDPFWTRSRRKSLDSLTRSLGDRISFKKLKRNYFSCMNPTLKKQVL